MLREGDKAPDFALKDQDGNLVRLSDYRGKRVVLFFYPKDSTPTWTDQAKLFAENYDSFQKRGIVILGINKDTQKSHQRFAKKNKLPYKLLSDPNKEAINAYGVWQEKGFWAKLGLGITRSTFIIDPNGIIEKVFSESKAKCHAIEVLEYIESL